MPHGQAVNRAEPLEEHEIPHEIMRFVAMSDELVLKSKLGNNCEHI
jgi:hypothetical protein